MCVSSVSAACVAGETVYHVCVKCAVVIDCCLVTF